MVDAVERYVVPANAGMNRAHAAAAGQPVRGPRERGDEPAARLRARQHQQWSPRTRG